MATSIYPSVSTALDQKREQERLQEQQADALDTNIFKMAWDLRGEHEVFDYSRLAFETDDNFKMADMEEDFNKHSKYVKDALVEANPASLEEYNYLVDKYSKLERDIATYQQQGMKYIGASVMASLLDPTSAAISLGTGFSGLGYKIAKGTYTALAVETIASEAAIAGAKLAFNPTYETDDAVLDMALAPAGLLPVYIGDKLSPIVRMNRENNRKYLNGLQQQFNAIRNGDTRIDSTAIPNQVSDYETAFVAPRFDRYAAVMKSDNEALKGDSPRILEDALGSMKDRQGQGGTVELYAHQMTDSLIPRFDNMALGALRKVMKEKGYSGMSRVFHAESMQQAMEQASRNIIRAAELGDKSILSEAERELFEVINETYFRAHRQSREAGVEAAMRFDHDENYIHLQYSSERIKSLEKELGGSKEIIKLLKKSFLRGAERDNNFLQEAEADLMARAMYHKIMRTDAVDTIDDFLNDPETFLRALETDEAFLKANPQAAKFDKEMLEKLLGRFKDKETGHLKRRARLDRLVTHKVNGREISMLDLMNHDLIQNTHSYVRNSAGRVGLARGLGIRNLNDWEKKKNQWLNDKSVRGEPAKVRKSRELIDDMENVIFGRPSYSHNPRAQRVVSAVNNWMTAIGLGNSGLANIPDLALAIQKSSLGAAFRSMPVMKKVFPTEDLDYLRETFAEVDLFINDPTWSNLLPNMALEGVEGATESTLESLSRKSANFTIKWSGMADIVRITQEIAFYGNVNKLFKAAQKGKQFHLNKAETGWSNDEVKRLTELMQKTPKLTKKHDGYEKTVNVPDLSTWSREDIRLLGRGLKKYADRVSSRVTRGEQGKWQESLPARVLLQFRTVVLNSYTKRALSGLARIGTKQGVRDAFTGALTSTAALSVVYWLKTESKMAGMSEHDKKNYLSKIGWDNPADYEKLFNGTWSERMEAISNISPQVASSIFSYSPTHGSVFEMLSIGLGAVNADFTGGRHRPIEEKVFGSPAAGYVENFGRLLKGVSDGEFNKEDLQRTRAMLPYGNSALFLWGTNAIIEEADLESED
jgi:hypothetical protein